MCPSRVKCLLWTDFSEGIHTVLYKFNSVRWYSTKQKHHHLIEFNLILPWQSWIFFLQELEILQQKLDFLNKRLNEADQLKRKGMFKKNPLWWYCLHVFPWLLYMTALQSKWQKKKNDRLSWNKMQNNTFQPPLEIYGCSCLFCLL